jgi:hypothetical protein
MKADDIGKMLDVYAIHVAKNSLGEPVARYAIEAYVAELKDRAEKAETKIERVCAVTSKYLRLAPIADIHKALEDK